jgi:hypothetical protein
VAARADGFFGRSIFDVELGSFDGGVFGGGQTSCGGLNEVSTWGCWSCDYD